MMYALIPMVVIGTVTLGIYKILELFVRRNERLSMIEKLSVIDPEILKNGINFPADINSNNSSWPIRFGLLLLGVGLGVIIAIVIDISTAIPINSQGQFVYRSLDSVQILYPSCAAVFGGIGLIVAYFIEKKYNK